MMQWLINDKVVSFLRERKLVPESETEKLRILSQLFPLRNTEYVINELIQWNNFRNDPIYQMTFPQKGMVKPGQYRQLRRSYIAETYSKSVTETAVHIRDAEEKLYGKKITSYAVTEKIPLIQGVWHQIPNTILLFPAPLQSCFAHCSYCGRWIMHDNLANRYMYENPAFPIDYIRSHPEISDVLFTGGDALIASAGTLMDFVRPILEIDSIQIIRFATKVLSYWPSRFLSDADSREMLELFSMIIRSGKHVAIMAHISHPKELSTKTVRDAIHLIHGTGAVIRCQCPLIKHVNDSVEILVQLWRQEINLGLVPYYLFIDDSQGLNNYFKIPIARAFELFKSSLISVSGLAKTVRGPVFNTIHGKILVKDIVTFRNERFFLLQFLQANNIERTGKSFLAYYDDQMYTMDQLRVFSQ
jgi:L-lysine 2,3-aminomutase